MAQPRFQLVPGARLTGAVGAGGIGWRLLGANNRELGRSSSSYPDAEEALLAIARVRGLASDDEAHIVHDPRTGLWNWELGEHDHPVAHSGRGFRHERECRYNLEQFRAAAPEAPTSEHEVPQQFPWQRSVYATIQPEGTS